MSISFSGLASGLDTSSWVESLVALRQAKITTLEEQKETVLLSRETLNNIKSFFNSFRSVLEKVTDAKFGIVSTDIFAQKLATSSNLNILTGTATHEAEEATYNVLVDKLATNTEAISGIKKMTTTVQTMTALADTKLVDLGVRTGNIGIHNNGAYNVIKIEEKDTISDFVNKLHDIGVDASYNPHTGIFGINLDNDSIDDTLTVHKDGSVGTGILDVLHLQEKGGYKSSFLEITNVETIVSAATGATKLSELGTIKAGNIQVKANDNTYTFAINGNTTLNDLINNLRSKGIEAALSKDGEFSIKDAEITDPNGTNIIDALGLQVATNSITQTANNLQYKTVVTTQTSATNSTKLGDLEGWKGSNSVLTVKNGNGVSTNITLTSDMTVGNLVNKLNNAGLSAVITSDGTLNISGGEISGDGADVLGIEPGNGVIANITLDGATLFAKTTTYATENTRLEDLGITTSDQLIMCGADGHTINVFSTGIVPDEYHYIKNVLSSLSSNHFTANINEGIITVSSSDGSYIKGGMAEKLGIVLSSSTITANGTITSKSPLTYTTSSVTTPATLDTKLSDIDGHVFGNGKIAVHKSDGSVVTITINTTQTLGDFFNQISAYGFTGSIDSSGNVTIKAQGNAYLETIGGSSSATPTFIEEVTRRDTSGMTSLASVNQFSALTSGTYSISTVAELRKLATMTNKGLIGENTEFVLANNIDFSESYFSQSIGDLYNPFTAKFDGNGYVISNLKKVVSTDIVVGLFGNVAKHAIIKNVGLADVNITGDDSVGGLVGTINDFVTISNCYATGNITANCNVGGLVGDSLASNSSITNCFADVTVKSCSGNVGGLVGRSMNTIIKNCYAAGECSSETINISTEGMGGLIGDASSTELTSCYATGTVTSEDYNIGGLIGNAYDATIKNCYTTGSLNIVSISSPLIGEGRKITFENAYFADTTGQKDGGYFGETTGTVTMVTTSELNALIANGTLPDFSRASSSSNLPDLFQTSAGASQTIYENTTNGTKLYQTLSGPATTSSKLGDIEFSDSSKLPFDSSGNTSLVVNTTSKDGIVKTTTIDFTKTQSLNDVIQALSAYGIKAYIDGGGRFTLTSDKLADFTVSGAFGDKIVGGKGKKYDISVGLTSKTATTSTAAATRDTLLSDLGVTSGEYNIYKNGVKYTALISSDETLGSFIETLQSFGLQAGLIQNGNSSKLVLIGTGDSYISKSLNPAAASNVVEKLFTSSSPTTTYDYSASELLYATITTKQTATEDTLLSNFDTPWGASTLKSAGDLVLSVNGKNKVVKILETDTFGSLIGKLNSVGVEARLIGGSFYISEMNNVSIIAAQTTSSIINPNATIRLAYKNHIDHFMESSAVIEKTTTTIEKSTLSAANYADLDTQLKTLNISNGNLSIFRNGEKATIAINSENTFKDLRSQIASKFSDLDLTFENGKLVIFSKTDGVEVKIGSTTDSSNFLSITGLSTDENGRSVSSRALFCVNENSLLTAKGLFRNGDVEQGNFIIGEAVLNIDDKTTVSDLISQINFSEKSNATAYWDSINGNFVLKSRTTGAALINIEAGTSNLTDIMGFTESEWYSDGSVKLTRMNTDLQKLGDNARVTINGTSYTATSNTLTSDITRIKGLTINLTGLTNGSAVTLKVEKDKETVANALSDIVNAYNELMKNVDEAVASDGALKKQTTLKMIRNQIRNLMTSSIGGNNTYKNLDVIGISVAKASSNNISTSNESIIDLSFDKDKFLKAYEADSDAVKELLIGQGIMGAADSTDGVFTKIESIVENSLAAVIGYFSITDEAYNREVKKMDTKIVKGNEAIEKYRASLNKKFQSMDMLISNMQNQYSSFLVT